MSSNNETDGRAQLVRLDPETLMYQPTGYALHFVRRDVVCISAHDEPGWQYRLPHPEVLTRVSDAAWAYDPPLSDQGRAFLDALARGVAARGLN